MSRPGRTSMNRALSELPRSFTGLDLLGQHHSPSDLAYSVQLNIDLFMEGDASDIKTRAQLEQYRKYVEKWGANSSDES